MRARTAVLSWGVVYIVLIGGLVVMGMHDRAHSADVALLPLPVLVPPHPAASPIVGPVPESVLNVTVKTSTPTKALRGLSVLVPKDGKRYEVIVIATPSTE